ncbi:hypothetical protein BVRB_9g215970 [Beta vulgaris subsp. vulgaris]|uniref:uncharacterized protein LOC104904237 n=1 Tax=Beta vulgaris subsp. vulgaris TaxID=3555 RepID=UPI00053FD30A|nr:uncharacterized protein LOC104904237 [Beta vulgaris subsp. vulgaris]KMT01601.1 hypothetical protein BVRB_9g215970 [Beta vulgaris subsp. vulgaris]
MTSVPMYPLIYSSRPGVQVSAWTAEPNSSSSSSPNPSDPNRRVDRFFTVHVCYHDTYIPNAVERSASFRLERTCLFNRTTARLAIKEWLDELDVDANAHFCAIYLVVESCDILSDEIYLEDRKSLEVTIKIKVGPEYWDVDDMNIYMDMDMDMDMEIDDEEEPHETYEEKKARMKEIETFLRTKNIIRKSKVDMGWQCSICLEDTSYNSSEQEVANLGCSHIFHGNCLVSWIFERKNSCPLCRSNIMAIMPY